VQPLSLVQPAGVLAASVRSAASLDCRNLALFRIAAGCLLIADAGLRSRDFWLFLSPDGVFPLPVLRDYLGPGCWSLSFLSADLRWQGLVLGLEALAGLMLLIGLFTPLACLLAWVIWVSLLRRTAPALNAGDYWLGCLLFWGLFLPLGDRWSVDARRRPPTANSSVCSPASFAFVMQVLAVYLIAGWSKLGGTWLEGTAISFALSPHDHGTPWGVWLAGIRWLIRPLTWGTVAVELVGPLVYLCSKSQRVRRGIALVFIVFHLGIWSTMTVGLFSPVGIAAWLTLLPLGGCFDAPSSLRSTGNNLRWQSLCNLVVACGCIIAASATIQATLRPRQQAPTWLTTAVNLLCLDQAWAMFGDVGPMEQWVTARTVLADGRVVDLLRRGQPYEPVRPDDGFWSLPNHRWHKLFWELPKPRQESLRPAVAAGLVADWNRRHPPAAAVRSLELVFTRVSHPGRKHPVEFPTLAPDGVAASDAPETVLRQWVLARWPPGDGGNLQRFLENL
jgi:uncharacterized membrane protein YphA (DoxX/SURF4 family)